MEREAESRREESHDEGNQSWAEQQKRKKRKARGYFPNGYRKSQPASRSDETHEEYDRDQITPLNILADCATKELKQAAREGHIRAKESPGERGISVSPSGASDDEDHLDKNFPSSVINGKRVFKCSNPVCKKIFPSLSRMRRHYIIHTGAKPFKCLNSKCNKTFSRRDNMIQHYRGHCVYTDKSERDILTDKENSEW